MCSNRSTNEPTDETQPVSRHSLTYFHSLPRISGTQRGIQPSCSRTAGSDDMNPRRVPFTMLLDPLDRAPQPVLQHDHRPPPEELSRQGIVGEQPLHLAPFGPHALRVVLDGGG